MTDPLKTIIVADDDPKILDLLQRLLLPAGYQISGIARNGQEAVDQTRQLKPQLILLDLQMPVLDGTEAARQILALGTTAVVMLTADGNPATAHRLLEMGVCAYMTKPFEMSQLVPVLESAWHRFQTQATLTQEKRELQETLETRKLLEKAKGILMEQQGLSEDEAHKTILTMSQNQGVSVKELCRSLIQVRMVLGGKPRTAPRKAA